VDLAVTDVVMDAVEDVTDLAVTDLAVTDLAVEDVEDVVDLADLAEVVVLPAANKRLNVHVFKKKEK